MTSHQASAVLKAAVQKHFLLGAWLAASLGCQILSGLTEYRAEGEGGGGGGALVVEPFGLRFGGAGQDVMVALEVTPSGRLVLAGTMQNVDFGGGPLVTEGDEDPFVAVLGPRGEHIASRSFGAADGDTISGLAVDAQGRVLVAGLFANGINFGTVSFTDSGVNAFVAFFEPDLTLRWAKVVTGFTGLPLIRVAFGKDGNPVIAGGLAGPVKFDGIDRPSQSNEDFFVTALEAQGGEVVWFTQLPSSPGGILDPNRPRGPRALLVDAAGAIYLVGATFGVIEAAGKQSTPDPDGDMAIVKLTPGGEVVEALFYGGLGIQRPGNAVFDAAGRLVVSGIFSLSYALGDFSAIASSATNWDVFLSRLDSDLSPGRSVAWAGAAPAAPDLLSSAVLSIAPGPDQTLLASGRVVERLVVGDITLENTNMQPNADAFLAVLDDDLEPTFARRWGDANLDMSLAVAVHPFGDVVLAGFFEGVLRLEQNEFQSKGAADIFVAHFAP